MRASMSCDARSIRVQPSGSVTAKSWSGMTIRPVVATLAAGLADAAADALADTLADGPTEGALDAVAAGDAEADAGVDTGGVAPHAAATSAIVAIPRRRARPLVEEVIRVGAPSQGSSRSLARCLGGRYPRWSRPSTPRWSRRPAIGPSRWSGPYRNQTRPTRSSTGTGPNWFESMGAPYPAAFVIASSASATSHASSSASSR